MATMSAPKPPPYDALIEGRRPAPDERARRLAAERLGDAARNLETLGQLADAEAREREQQATFTLGWIEVPGSLGEAIGAVTLPNRPTTLGEARGGLEMVGADAEASIWLQRWADSPGAERDLVLRLPDGWFELRAATLAAVPGAAKHYLVRFERRCPARGPAQ
jgi:hypothetical protein